MSVETRIRVALLVAALAIVALAVLGAMRSGTYLQPVTTKAGISDTANPNAKATASEVEEACNEAKIRLLTAKAEEYEPFERMNLEDAVEKLCD